MEIIIVLGNRRKPIMEKRVNRALAEFNSSPISYYSDDMAITVENKMLLFSGGSCDGVSKPEGAVMMDEYALAQGVPKEHIILETESRTTRENILFVKKILGQMYPPNEINKPRLVICTSSFHIVRAMVLAKLYLSDYNTRFIHTNENISTEEYTHENKIMLSTIYDYANSSGLIT